MGITITRDDGLVPLSIDGKEAKVDPFELDEVLREAFTKKGPNGEPISNRELTGFFNEYLAKLEPPLPPVTVRGFAAIWIEVEKIIEEIKKKDGWASSRSTMPNSAGSTDSTFSASQPEDENSFESLSPQSVLANGSTNHGPG